MTDACDGYAREADRLRPLYDALDVPDLYAPIADHVPRAGERVLDVGAGTGRDAAYWAAQGCHVTALDPVPELSAHRAGLVTQDCLPDLSTLGPEAQFEVITAIGVLHHLSPPDQSRAVARIAGLLVDGGRALLSLRHGPAPQTRPGFAIDVATLEAAGLAAGCVRLLRRETASIQPFNIAAGVRWTWLVLSRSAEKRL